MKKLLAQNVSTTSDRKRADLPKQHSDSWLKRPSKTAPHQLRRHCSAPTIQEAPDSHNIFATFLPGDHILLSSAKNPYRRLNVISEIGRGAYGPVIHAITETGEGVAIKTAVPPEYRKCLENEYATTSGLRHPNVLSSVLFYTSRQQITFRGQPISLMVMPLMSCTLHDAFQNEHHPFYNPVSTLSNKQLKRIVRGMFAGLDYLDREGISHRDLKPENLLLNISDSADPNTLGEGNKHQNQNRRLEYDDIKIADFGMATKDTNSFSYYKQSRFYRSPEFALGALPADTKVDVWSAGLIVAKLLFDDALFGISRNNKHHQTNILELLGRPPQGFVDRMINYRRWVSDSGHSKRYEGNGIHFQGSEDIDRVTRAEFKETDRVVNRVLRRVGSCKEFVNRNIHAQGLYYAILQRTLRYVDAEPGENGRSSAGEILELF